MMNPGSMVHLMTTHSGHLLHPAAGVARRVGRIFSEGSNPGGFYHLKIYWKSQVAKPRFNYLMDLKEKTD
jgi:hypothetical protein